jgi:integrase
LKYRSGFDVQKLIAKAQDELSEADPECFKIFLLAVMVGLRRHEIDLLEWDSFHWDASVIRIEPTEYFLPKSEDSIGDVPVDPELMEIFRGYRARRPRDRFVIMARGGAQTACCLHPLPSTEMLRAADGVAAEERRQG